MDEVDKSRYMMITLAGLSNDEINQFHAIRNLWAKNAYFEAADLTTQIIEKKLRSFLLNAFTLLYGERTNRLNRVDDMTKQYILQNIQKDQTKGLGVSRNEFEQVNRGNYKNFVIGFYNKEVGRRNWMQMFKQVFSPLTENDVRDFLDMLADFNIATSHAKYGAFGAEQQTRIFSYILRARDITSKMNQAYVMLIEKCLQVIAEEFASPKLFFSFCNLEDKDSLTPILVKPSNAQRVGEQLLRESRISVDLEDYQFIESCYSVEYREFMAILARLIAQTPMEAKKTGLRATIEDCKGSLVTLGVVKY